MRMRCSSKARSSSCSCVCFVIVSAWKEEWKAKVICLLLFIHRGERENLVWNNNRIVCGQWYVMHEEVEERPIKSIKSKENSIFGCNFTLFCAFFLVKSWAITNAPPMDAFLTFSGWHFCLNRLIMLTHWSCTVMAPPSAWSVRWHCSDDDKRNFLVINENLNDPRGIPMHLHLLSLSMV